MQKKEHLDGCEVFQMTTSATYKSVNKVVVVERRFSRSVAQSTPSVSGVNSAGNGQLPSIQANSNAKIILSLMIDRLRFSDGALFTTG